MSPSPTTPLLTLPSELLLHILSFLDVPELLSTSRTSHHLRHLCLDPLLHTARLIRASLTLARSIPCRPALSELVQLRIYVSKTSATARSLGRNLIKACPLSSVFHSPAPSFPPPFFQRIKLNRSLQHRPTPEHLVEQGVLPRECLHTRVAPSLISTKRRIEKEKVKDALRHWIEEWRRKGSRTVAAEEVERRPEVSVLVRRFAREGQQGKGKGVQRWGSQAAEGERELPTRAKVLGLRRYWERVGKDGVSN